MGQTQPPIQPQERRITNLHEVNLGYGKKQNLEESRRCPQCAEPSCLSGCPLGIDIPGFIRLLREDDTSSALERIKEQNPFPAICGRICPAPCERACIFFEDGAPIAIRALERYASDFGKLKPIKLSPVMQGKRVAVIGSGPSGMSAAFYLAKAGFGVTIFEAMDEPGGLLRYGVPEFRLPQKILDEQFNELASLGVKIETNVFVGRTESILNVFNQGFVAVLLTVGAGLPEFIDFPGHDLGGVYYAEEFLLRVQMFNKTKTQDAARKLFLGDQTVVIGSGYSALDSARLARRMGQEVALIFGGLEEELGVRGDDLELAVEEGVKLLTPVRPERIDGDAQGFAKSVQGSRLEVVEEKEQLELKEIQDGQIVQEAQTVILSHGRVPNLFLSKHLPQLQCSKEGAIETDKSTGLTSVDRIFAAGNVVTGAGPVVDAIANGKRVAVQIKEFLSK